MILYQDADYKVECLNHCYFRLDGGAMFGMIPKKIWNKLTTSDSDNCIKLASLSLLITTNDHKIIVDLGMGNKWSEKLREIYALEDLQLPLSELQITDIILTHLHLDHAGSISYYNNEQLCLTLPTATVHLQAENLANARNPNIREQGSYLTENIAPLENAKLNLLAGTTKLFNFINCHPIHGHTQGQQWLEINLPNETIAFPGDLMPTSAHILPHYNMGYDICPQQLLNEKALFLEQAIKGNWLVVFQHDPSIAAGRIILDDRGRPCLSKNSLITLK